MLKLCLLLCCVSCARGSEPAAGPPGLAAGPPGVRASGPAALAAAGAPGAALCLRGAACAGALWAPRWLLARASCLRGRRLEGARVLPYRDITHCNNITEAMSPIGVLEHYYEHPAFRDAWAGAERCDAALVQLTAPAAAAAPAADRARAAASVPELAAWLQWVPAAEAAAARAAPPTPRPPHWRVASTPLRLLAATVVLPLATLLLLFALALRISWGQPDDVPYDVLERQREGNKEPDPPAPARFQPEAGDFEDILPMSLPL